jgi:hypothetical protein
MAEGCSEFNPVELEQQIMRDVADRQNLAGLQEDNFGTSAIQDRYGAE